MADPAVLWIVTDCDVVARACATEAEAEDLVEELGACAYIDAVPVSGVLARRMLDPGAVVREFLAWAAATSIHLGAQPVRTTDLVRLTDGAVDAEVARWLVDREADRG